MLWKELSFVLAYLIGRCLSHGGESKQDLYRQWPSESDRQISFIRDFQLEEQVIQSKNSTWLIFYADRYEKFSKKFSRVWLDVQQELYKRNYPEFVFNMAKMDCRDSPAWCKQKGVNLDDFPQVFLYHNGAFIEQYKGDEWPVPLMEYIESKIQLYSNETGWKSKDLLPTDNNDVTSSGIAVISTVRSSDSGVLKSELGDIESKNGTTPSINVIQFHGFFGFLQAVFIRPLIGAECSNSLLSFQWLSRFDCTCLFLSKILGFGLVAGGAFIKLPQILKIISQESALGVSFSSYAMETGAYIAGVAYNVRKGNSFFTYGEHAFMAFANCVVVALMFHYSNRQKDLVSVGVSTLLLTISLFSRFIISDTLLLIFQWIALLIGAASKIPQIHSNWTHKSCGHLSAMTVGLQTIGSLARCFTTAIEVKDTVIFVTYFVAAGLNGTVLYQIRRYWGRRRKTKSLLD